MHRASRLRPVDGEHAGYKSPRRGRAGHGLFTNGTLTQATGEDNHEAVVGLALLDEGSQPQVLGDSAYGTGDARAALIKAGHTAIIKPGPLRPASTSA